MEYEKWPTEVEVAMMTVLAYLVERDPEPETPEDALLEAMTDYREPYERKNYG